MVRHKRNGRVKHSSVFVCVLTNRVLENTDAFPGTRLGRNARAGLEQIGSQLPSPTMARKA